jgi:plastocyanin
MNVKYLYLAVAMIALYATTRYEKQSSASSGSWTPASARGPAVLTDTANESEVIGSVTLSGPGPKNSAINMAADPLCAKLHTRPVMTEELVLSSGNALANAVVYVSEGLGDRAFDTPKQPAVLEQTGCQYRPHIIALMAGQKLLVENGDPTTHNIHPVPVNNREWNQSQAQGVPPIEATFGREEISIPVKCNIHAWMKGYIAVFKHPYFAVTGSDGGFVLKNLPPGNYTITAWQERFGTLTQKVTIAPKEKKRVEFIFKPQGGG